MSLLAVNLVAGKALGAIFSKTFRRELVMVREVMVTKEVIVNYTRLAARDRPCAHTPTLISHIYGCPIIWSAADISHICLDCSGVIRYHVVEGRLRCRKG